MNIRRALTGALVVGALTLGGASAAVAAEPTTPPALSAACRAAKHVLHDLRVLDRHLREAQRRLIAARDRAAEAGNDDLVARLDAQIARDPAAHERAVTRIEAAVARVRDKCAAAEVPAAA